MRWKKALPEAPNATCRECGAKVWFFRNEFGGCAYFDALGPPWPLHPCFEAQPGHQDRAARRQAVEDYEVVRRRAKRNALREQRRAVRNGRREIRRTVAPSPPYDDAARGQELKAVRARAAADNASVKEARRTLKRDKLRSGTSAPQRLSRVERQTQRSERAHTFSSGDRKRFREDPIGTLSAPPARLAPTHVEGSEFAAVPGCGVFLAMMLVVAAVIVLVSVAGR